MAINEEQRQLDIARASEEHLRALAHSTRDVPSPSDSYQILGELGAITDHLVQVLEQLASWHHRVEDGTHYDAENGDHSGSPGSAGIELSTAANALKIASTHVGRVSRVK